MRTTVRQAIGDASDLIRALMDSNLSMDQVIELDDSFDFYPVIKRTRQKQRLFEQVQTDSYLNEGELVYFDYVDSNGDFSERVGYVINPNHTGRHGKVIMIHDLEKDEPRWFNAERMNDIWLLRPV